MTRVLDAFTLGWDGSSLGRGRLCGDIDATIAREAETYPEAVGPVSIVNIGQGGSTSADVLARAPRMVNLRPKFIVCEPCAINSCVDFGSGPAVSRPQHIQNMKDIVALYRAGIPGVDITFMTMSTISAEIAALRPNYDDYSDDERATAALLGVRMLDNKAGWPNPLPIVRTYGGGWAGLDAGFLDWDAATTWNPADKSADVTLSGGNLVMTSAVTHRAARAITGRSAGKYHFDAVCSGSVGWSVGVGKATAGLGTYVGGDADSYSYYYTGDYRNSGSSSGAPPAYGAGDRIGVDVDLGAHKVWFSKNGVAVNGDPIAGTGGMTISAGTYYPMVSLGAGGFVTANFTQTPGDGLHPVKKGAVDTYLKPGLTTLIRSLMAGHFGL